MKRSSPVSRFFRTRAPGLFFPWLIASCVALALVTFAPSPGAASEAQWIWSPNHKQDQIPLSTCYFRKTIYLRGKHVGTMEIAADDAYELYLNGKKVGDGQSWQQMTTHDVTQYLKDGKNLVAIRVTNRSGSTAGLAARLRVQRVGENARIYLTNPTWRTNLSPLPMWNNLSYLDTRWKPARAYGPLHGTAPWIVEGNPTLPAPMKSNPISKPERVTKVATVGGERAVLPDKRPPVVQQSKVIQRSLTPARFTLPEGFQVQQVAGHEETGSLVAMTFNEFGQLLAARENGPLLLIHDSNGNGIPDTVRIYCDQVTNCQGILSLSGDVYVVGSGPEGLGLYRLEDRDRDGQAEVVNQLIPFTGKPGEHGPHGLVLGPDGMIYLAFGNQTRPAVSCSRTSPLRDYYEGDLLAPRYEDPQGQAAGMTAPGGGVLRLDSKAQRIELVAGGLRNACDLAFDGQGELFLHDSGMESDRGTSWYRPARVLHIVPGGEYGWRSGWAKWPAYFVDNLPSTLDTPLSSPTGLVFYNHHKYPPRYANVMFACDWSQGRILAIGKERSGASFSSSSEVFLQGKPLNVTDIDVGPDGWLYFCTGGRGTRGNIFRIVFQENSKSNSAPKENGQSSVSLAIDQPQIQSAWARQKVATIRGDMGQHWDRDILNFVYNKTRAGTERAKALRLMHLVGPPPSDATLIEVSYDPDDDVRATSAMLLGLIDNATSRQRLLDMLHDDQSLVRRRACEALTRTQQQVPYETLTSMLASPDRFESWAARCLLQCNHSGRWQQKVLKTHNLRLFVQGSIAMLLAEPSHDLAEEILDRSGKLAGGRLDDEDFSNLLRVVQLAVTQGDLTPEELSAHAPWIPKRFPAESEQINHLLVPLIVCMQDDSAVDALLTHLESDDLSPEGQVFEMMNLRFLKKGWNLDRKMKLVGKYESALQHRGGDSLAGYIEHAMRDFTATFEADEIEQSLARGDRFPEAAVAVLHRLPEQLPPDKLKQLLSLDDKIQGLRGSPFERLRIGIIAVLARSQQPEAMSYLRELYERDPQRRPAAAMGLAQNPTGRNWDYLIRSIPQLEGQAVREVLVKLRKADYVPESPEHISNVILAGLELKDQGGTDAAALLEHWLQERPYGPDASWSASLSAWQQWFTQRYPDQEIPSLPLKKVVNGEEEAATKVAERSDTETETK